MYLKVENIVCMLSNWNFCQTVGSLNVELKASLVPQGDQQLYKEICRERETRIEARTWPRAQSQ